MDEPLNDQQIQLLQLLYKNQAWRTQSPIDLQGLYRQQPLWPRNLLESELMQLRHLGLVEIKPRVLGNLRLKIIFLTQRGKERAEQIKSQTHLKYTRDFKFENFDVHFAHTNDRLQVEVLSSPSGETHEVSVLPPDTAQLLTSGKTQNTRHIAKEIGEALLPLKVRSLWQRSLSIVKQTKGGLRIRIRTQDERLASVPWELAWIDENTSFLSLGLQTPMVRYISTENAPSALTVQDKFKILVVTSSPAELSELNVEEEHRRVEEALAPMTKSGQIEITYLPLTGLQALQNSLRQGYHVLHFVGHGFYDEDKNEGALIAVDEVGRAGIPVSAEWLSVMVRDSNVRFTFFNACESGRTSGGVAETLVRKGIMSAALGMHTEIEDSVAIAFMSAFYSALCDRWPIDVAVTEGRKAIVNCLQGNTDRLEWAQPVLYMRSPDGQIFA